MKYSNKEINSWSSRQVHFFTWRGNGCICFGKHCNTIAFNEINLHSSQWTLTQSGSSKHRHNLLIEI